MPLDNITQRSRQRSPVKLTTQTKRQRDRVARTATFQPIQKPKPTLRIRKRKLLWPPNRSKTRTSSLAASPQPLRKPGNRRRLKQAADRNFNIKARPDPADQTRRQKRMAAKLKEALVNPDPRNTQNLGKQTAQQLLLRRARRTTHTCAAKLRSRKRPPVKLPVRRQRQSR